MGVDVSTMSRAFRTNHPTASIQPQAIPPQQLNPPTPIDDTENAAFRDIDFEHLEPGLQRPYLSRLRAEIARLQDIERRIGEHGSWPAESPSHGSLLMPTVEHKELNANTSPTPQSNFQHDWSYVNVNSGSSSAESRTRIADPRITWHLRDLVADSPNPELDLPNAGQGLRMMDEGEGGYSSRPDPGVSSQLLLYRLVHLFQIPAEHFAGEFVSTHWGVELCYRDEVSTLDFYDVDGAPSGYFCGAEDASVEALRLVRYLFRREETGS